MPDEAKSFCRNCGALCSMVLTVEDGRLLSARGDGSVSPYGEYMCPKGLAAVDFHNGEDGRLLETLKRTPSGLLEPHPVDRALEEIATRLTTLVREHGPRSVALYHGTGAYRSVLGGLLERSFMAAIGSPELYSTMTIDQSAKWVTMSRMGLMASGKPAFQDVDVAVLVGNNPVVSHQAYPFGPGESGAPARALAAARKRGTKIVVVDPRRTETARHADLLIQPLPGHDATLFAAIAHVLLRDGTWNRDFYERFVSQLDALRAAVEPFTPERAARWADVPVGQIELAARWLGEARRPFVGSGTGPSMSLHSNLNDHMIEAVNVLVGGYRRAGDPVRNPGTLKPRGVRERVVPPDRSWERAPKCRTKDIGQIFGEFPSALLPDEILAPGEDRIRALIVFGGNPLMALGDPDEALPAFEALDLLVCLDARLNETGELAHYVVATSQPFERHDLTLSADSLFPEPFAQYARPVLPKPPGVVDDWEFFWRVASHMRVRLTFKPIVYGVDFDLLPGGLELDMDRPPDPEDLIRHLCTDSRVPFEVLRESPSGVRPEPWPQRVKPAREGGARLELCPEDVAAELAGLLAEETAGGPVADAPFPLRLVSRRLLETMNSAYRDSARTRRKHPINFAWMNPDDMRERGITEDRLVEIESETGAIRGVARADAGLRRGVVSMAHLFGALAPALDPRDQGGSFTGRLTSLRRHLEPINSMPRFSGLPVRVRSIPHSDQEPLVAVPS